MVELIILPIAVLIVLVSVIIEAIKDGGDE
jgi:hypothetical protein